MGSKVPPEKLRMIAIIEKRDRLLQKLNTQLLSDELKDLLTKDFDELYSAYAYFEEGFKHMVVENARLEEETRPRID